MDPEVRRVSERVPARFPVNCSCEGNYLVSYTRDVSVDGMFICTRAPAPVGAQLQLVFSIGELHEVAVGGRVVWVSLGEGGSDAGMGVQFLSPPRPLQDAVLELVHRIAILDRGETRLAVDLEHAKPPGRGLPLWKRKKSVVSN